MNKRKTLSELIDEITNPVSLDQRVDKCIDMYAKCDHFRLFVDITLGGGLLGFEQFTFKTKLSPLSKTNFVTYTSDLLVKYIPSLKNDKMKTTAKHALLSTLLEEICGDDVPYILSMVHGSTDFPQPKFNRLLLQRAFPEKKFT